MTGNINQEKHHNSDSTQTCTLIIQSLIESHHAKSCLIINHTEHAYFGKFKVDELIEVDNQSLFPHSGAWPVVVGLFPLYQLARKTVGWLDNQKYYSCAGILKTLQHLDKNGVGIFFIERHALSASNKDFFSALAKRNFTIEHIIGLPNDFFKSVAGPLPIMVTIRHGQASVFQITQIENSQHAAIFAKSMNSKNSDMHNSLDARLSSDEAKKTHQILAHEFTSADTFWLNQRMRDIGQRKSQDYTETSLKAISTTVNRSNSDELLAPINNSLYISRGGKRLITSQYSNLPKSHSSTTQLVISEHTASADYLDYYFRTEIGQMLIASCSDPSRAHGLDITTLINSPIIIPSLESQHTILDGLSKIRRIRAELTLIEDELWQRPGSVQTITDIDELMNNRSGAA